MYTYQQRLEYARKLKRLHDLYVIKDNIHLTYKYKNQNKAIHNAHSLQDKIINSIIDDAVYGNANAIKNIDSTIEKLMTSTLENERKRIHHQKDKYVSRAVELNSKRYSEILSNRINTEAVKLQRAIESELRSGIHNGLSESETRKVLQEKYQDTAKARIRNIIRDGIHTNESNISFINALNNGYNYKVWMNGRSKGKTRAWHKAKLITPVPIEDYFDIYGSYHAQLMYPGDLYGGAENVANCRCWLRYTNRRPEGLSKTPNTYNIPNTSYLSLKNKTNKNPFGEKVKVKPIETIKTTISTNTKKITSKIKNISKKITSKITKTKSKTKLFKRLNNEKFKQRFNSLKSDVQKSIKPDNWITSNINNLPKDIPESIKELIIEFESHTDKIFDGNEWSQIYNITKGAFTEIRSDGHENRVNPYGNQDYGSDILIIIHNHIRGDPFSPTDLAKSLNDSENIKYLLVTTPTNIFIAELKYKGSIGFENADSIFKKAESIQGEEWNKGWRLGVNSWDEIYDNMWERYKSDKTINKYIKGWRKIKK